MKARSYNPVPNPDQAPAARFNRFPREPDLLVYGLRAAANLCVRACLLTYHRLHVVGRENLPRDLSFVLVANHSSHLDVLCLLSALPLRQLHRAFPAAAADYFFGSVTRVALSVLVVNAMPFYRKARF